MAPEKLTEAARRAIELHLDAHNGLPPDHMPRIRQVMPWSLKDREPVGSRPKTT